MSDKIEELLNADGWKGICSRLTLELTSFVTLIYCGDAVTWIERTFFGRMVLIDRDKERSLITFAACLLAFSLICELVYMTKLIISYARKRRGS